MLDLWDRRGVKVTSMTMQRICLLGFPVLCGVLLLGIASVRAMQMVESFPSARTVVEGRNAQYVVRFDALVNHRDSRLTIIQHDRVLRTLQPILRSDPKALTASAPRLPTGDYELHWSALLREYCAAGRVPAGGVINRFGWWLAYLSLSSGSARCIQSLLRPADRTESERIDAGQ